MKLLFLCYWGINEGLTQATVIPHLEILSELPSLESIDFVTIERGSYSGVSELPEKVKFTPIESRNFPINLLNKVLDVWLIEKELVLLIKKNEIDFIIGRNAVAGAICHRLQNKHNIPYAVESFEPHADYMRESGVWSRWDPRYLFQKRWEKLQKKTATLIMPVSHHCKEILIEEGVSASKIEVMPCAVNLELFKFSEEGRNRIREKLRISKDATVGVYVGKFGGIYFNIEEAQLVLNEGFNAFKNFHLIILSQYSNEVESLTKAHENRNRIHTLEVEHHEVPDFLSASDFAFNFHLPHDFSTNFSPIKNGEYWASGLPIMLPDRIGDDSEITKKSGLGAVLKQGSLESTYQEISKILNRPSSALRKSVRHLAFQHRNFEISKKVYKSLFGNL